MFRGYHFGSGFAALRHCVFIAPPDAPAVLYPRPNVFSPKLPTLCGPWTPCSPRSTLPVFGCGLGAVGNNAGVSKWVKLFIGLLLLPACAGACAALWRVLRASGNADRIWVAVLAGAACWVVIYLLLPKPMWVYVLGHELTHALSTWLMGGKVKKFKATGKGGHVVVTKNNFVISLAPYFCPLYAILVVLLFVAGHLIWNWRPYAVWFHLLLGSAYAFHVTLTAHILRHRQSDLTEHGCLFSAVIIFLGNLVVLLAGVPVLTTRVGVLTAFGWWLSSTGDVLRRLGGLF